jgi:hypothetical protein
MYEKIKLYQLALRCLAMTAGAIIIFLGIIIIHNEKQILQTQLQIIELLKFLREPVVVYNLPSQIIDKNQEVKEKIK